MSGDPTLDPEERRVRDALHDTVDDLEPVSGLAAIRSRIQEDVMSAEQPRSPSRTALLALGGAAAVAVVVTGVVLVTQDAGRPDADAPPAATSQTPSTGVPSTPPTSPVPSTPASTDASTPAGSTTRAVPVYYVGGTPAGPRLYREFHRVEVVGDDLLGRAVRQAVEAPPLDPDYRTPWPGGTRVDAVTSDGDTITIDLSGPTPGSLHDRPSGMSRGVARMAVQQLVYTAQAAVQDRLPVRLTLDGSTTDQVLGQPAAEPLANGAEESTLASIWVTSPQDGDTVRAGDVTVTGLGAFFEATAVWQLLGPDGSVVADGSGMARECCVRSPFELTLPDVPPGEYTVRVYDEDMSGGESGRPEAQDTKRITVE